MLLEFDAADRETLTKPLLARLGELTTVAQFASVLYHTVVYRHAALELLWLSDQLEQAETKLTPELFREYLGRGEGGGCVGMLALEEGVQKEKEVMTGALQMIAEGALLKIFNC